MARYIDADKLIEHLKDEIKACEPVFFGRANGKSVAYGIELGLKSAISFSETHATVDVAPKSEVEKFALIHKHIQKIILEDCDYATREAYEREYNKELSKLVDTVTLKSEVAREIEALENEVGKIYNHYVFEDTDYADDDVAIEAVINALTEVLNELDELKKKYTEGE